MRRAASHDPASRSPERRSFHRDMLTSELQQHAPMNAADIPGQSCGKAWRSGSGRPGGGGSGTPAIMKLGAIVSDDTDGVDGVVVSASVIPRFSRPFLRMMRRIPE
mmetsp:Transcript_108006/g.302537  ORF Transcript_108006/g.302537 Transcript_108006/m.302537 type:complete len:106 (-) Transcript_108006:230-547(-)